MIVGHEAFWSTVAQVIPIASASAIVAGLFGGRNFSDMVTRSFVASTLVSAVALVFAVLETIALCVLAGIAKDSPDLREIALVGTVAAFFLTSAGTAFFARPYQVLHLVERWRRRRAGRPDHRAH